MNPKYFMILLFFPTRFRTFKGDCVVVYQWTFIPFSPCLSCLSPDCNWMVQSFHFHKNLFFVNFQRNKGESRRSGLTQINQILRISRPSRPCLNFGEKKQSCHNKTLSSECLCLMSDKDLVLINFSRRGWGARGTMMENVRRNILQKSFGFHSQKLK